MHALITARHQSVVVIIGWEKPKELDRDKQEQIRHLELEALPKTTLQQMFESRLPSGQADEKWMLLCDRYANNPKLIRTAISTVKKFFNGSIEQFLRQKPILLEDIREILDIQFERIPNLEKKIAYLLAIDCVPITIEQLKLELVAQSSKLDLLKSLKNLEQMGFLVEQKMGYTLSPLAKDYLRCKLLTTVCQQIDGFARTDK